MATRRNSRSAGQELRGLLLLLVVAVALIIAAKTGLLTAVTTSFGNFMGGIVTDGIKHATVTP
jgi:hypothetical protein